MWVAQDVNYNVVALFDNSGSVVERYAYDPFGQVTVLDADFNLKSGGSDYAWLYLHQGGRYDATSGLYHFRFRDYSPTLARWTRLDPIRYAAGDVNLYRYVGNTPTIYVDPSGQEGDLPLPDHVAVPLPNSRLPVLPGIVPPPPPWWDYSILGHPRTGWFAQVSNFGTAVSDEVTMGLTRRIRRWGDFDDVVDYHSGAYLGGQIAGTGVNLGLAFANPCAMGGSVGTAVRVINGVQAVRGALNARDNLAAGNYGAAALDLVRVAFNSFQMVRPCFPGDVQVLTRRGWVRWDALTTTDEVLSLPEDEPEGELAYRPVEEVFQRWGRIWEVTVAGRVLRTTAEHPFWVRGRGWTAARELRVGDALRSHDGQWLAVEAVRDTGREEVVHNCRVTEYHSYFVGDESWGWSVWAHNRCFSRIHEDPRLVRHAEAAGRTHQASIDRLTAQLAKGNFNPGIGTKRLFGNVLEARARDGARIYFRILPNGDVEILAKSSKANQSAVIKILQQLYGR